ncbi:MULTISPECIES: CRISPR-associated protein Cas4 [Eubacteriales]|uniref:CRISPR-associated exonuclease Cas4 n=1 Tax=Clostridium isatidis TaxID=182773 RepID=A0A343JB64_9CLOT|nr:MULTISPECIES: CRISPR-associated protein Cas4 [Eubacteriales]ASW42772.1 CRISPR-associated protein Cas4 [Clostridium isatidis]MBU5454529.1 CRISPR-associated protein Cas4 [Caproiciproducens sp. MSJ-32]NLZ34056.1 CRISPR-associated protein Cas4 [Clostridiales bacterium]
MYQSLFNEFEEYITPSEIIEFLYCPRFTYFIKNLNIRQYEENRFKVQLGREKHLDKKAHNDKQIRKRIGGISKEQEKYLISKKLGIKGIVDEIYLLNDGSYAPLDYKFAEYKERDFETYKIQMALYSLIIEEAYNAKVNKFYLVYLRSKNLLKEIEFDGKLKKKCLKYIEDYKKVLKGYYPKATKSKARCIDCCYRNICEK